jgi:hypothetical protein
MTETGCGSGPLDLVLAQARDHFGGTDLGGQRLRFRFDRRPKGREGSRVLGLVPRHRIVGR